MEEGEGHTERSGWGHAGVTEVTHNLRSETLVRNSDFHDHKIIVKYRYTTSIQYTLKNSPYVNVFLNVILKTKRENNLLEAAVETQEGAKATFDRLISNVEFVYVFRHNRNCYVTAKCLLCISYTLRN